MTQFLKYSLVQVKRFSTIAEETTADQADLLLQTLHVSGWPTNSTSSLVQLALISALLEGYSSPTDPSRCGAAPAAPAPPPGRAHRARRPGSRRASGRGCEDAGARAPRRGSGRPPQIPEWRVLPEGSRTGTTRRSPQERPESAAHPASSSGSRNAGKWRNSPSPTERK